MKQEQRRAFEPMGGMFEPAAFVSEAHAIALTTRVPASGAWRDGDPIGNRKFVNIGDIQLESGAVIPSVRISYEQWGELNPIADNAVLILHGLTGDSHVIGKADNAHPTSGWWPTMVGPGKTIDTNKYCVLAPNVLGGCQGSTGPSSLAQDREEWGSRFPFLTIRDQVVAQIGFATAIGVKRFAAVIGGSMGAMHVLEWAIMAPDSLERLAVLAAPPVTSADQIALNTVQLDAIRLDPGFHGGDYYDLPDGDGPGRGLSLARRMAMLNYRTSDELNNRFARSWQSNIDPLIEKGRFAVQSYLDFHGNRFTRRFDANSYLILTESMNSHDVGRGRGSVAEALGSIKAKSLVLGISSDRYFPIASQREIASHLKNSVHGVEPIILNSEFGHDAFLIDEPAVSKALTQLFAA